VTTDPLLAAVGLLLLFFVPGYAVVKATFPEWRVRGPDALRRGLEIGTLAFVLSVVLTVVIGYVLLAGAPGGFQAAWSQPVLEAALAAIAAVAFVAGWVRGAYRRDPPVVRNLADPDAGEAGAWEITRELERLQREERRLLHRIRTSPPEGAARDRVEQELRQVREKVGEIQRLREAEYAR
jgi:Protein of unknown function (DUF1616)